MGFFIETLIGGLMAGMLYSLVALGEPVPFVWTEFPLR